MFSKVVINQLDIIQVMKRYTTLLTLILLAIVVNAQDIPFDKNLFKDRKDEFKEARNYLNEGYKLFEVMPSTYIDNNQSDYKVRAGYYKEALPLLFKANKFNPNNAELNYRIGRCYIVSSVYKDECIPHYEKALKLNPNVAPDIQYQLGIGYHITMQFDKAIAAFKKYKSTLVSKNPAELEDVDKRI